MRSMRKDLEAEEKWLGQEDKKALIRTRSFMDKFSALIDLCIYQEDRVLETGKEDQNEEEEREFEVLNLSELKDQWDNEDSQICKNEEVVDEQN